MSRSDVMKTVHVHRKLRASPDRVFDLLADHAGYTRFPGVRSAKVTRPGASEPNGLGAIREVSVGPAWFEEEITAFERPTLLEYRILRSRPPVDHELGRITLVAVSEGVEVTWVSKFRVTLPLVGGLATSLAVRQLTRGFEDVLTTAEALTR